MDVLNRAAAPIGEVEWQFMTEAVVRVVRRHLVGRRFLTLYGPLGPGAQIVAVDRTPAWETARVGMASEDVESAPVERIYQRIPLIAQDFVVDWRDLEDARATGRVLDWSKAEAAASFVALAEDHLIFHGQESQGLEGLLTVEGRHVLPSTTLGEPGSGFAEVARAVSHLVSAGFVPPFAVVAGVTQYAGWHRLYGNSGVLEVEQIARMVEGGVFESPLVPDDSVLVVARGAENLDLAVGLDVNVAFVESTHMNHIFRVLETVSLRIKRPSAICQIWRES
ncbi:MAG: family 1 encapsulin nanocompartment shell protein [Firmicutes bacterium]|nr:family 1 encapsulin nanocompartment shell protein [Bacillota bacterium]